MKPSLTKDLHFSGYAVSHELITELLALGFVRDLFTNNTRCATTQFHATYKGIVPINQKFFEKVCTLMKKYPDTVADLEMESCNPRHRIELKPVAREVLESVPHIAPFKLIACPVGITKAADIHIACNMADSSAYALHFIEKLEMISFDRPMEHGFKRIYTLTFQDVLLAIHWFNKLHETLSKLHMFSGKIKLEFLQKQFRMPENAPVLPLVKL
jgi:hypothetical protein